MRFVETQVKDGRYDTSGSHVLSYHLIDGGIEVVRILPERMDDL